jgi:DNA-binding NtrC family response regulator
MNGSRCILVVEDEELICDCLGTLLELEGYNPVLTHNGAQALEKFRENPFEIVLCDIRMPVMDGIELLKQLKVLAPLTKVIFMSGYSDVNREKALEMGAADFIRKPFDFSDVSKVLSAHFCPPSSLDLPAS